MYLWKFLVSMWTFVGLLYHSEGLVYIYDCFYLFVKFFVYLWKFLVNLWTFVEFLCVFNVILCVNVNNFSLF